MTRDWGLVAWDLDVAEGSKGSEGSEGSQVSRMCQNRLEYIYLF